jgi:DNA polymerase
MLVLGCGYGMGAKGFQKNAATWGVILALAESKRAVDAYRTRYRKVVEFWYACKNAAIDAISNPGIEFWAGEKVYYKLVADRNKHPWLMAMLPSGRAIYYNNPKIGEGEYGLEVSAMGTNPYTKKWQRLRIIPGRFAENNTQGFCRDVLARGKLNLEDAGFELILSVHDEAVAEVPETFSDLEGYCKLMCDMPTWADGLPLAADGMIEKRYRKM